jgi:hypothetical protein
MGALTSTSSDSIAVDARLFVVSRGHLDRQAMRVASIDRVATDCTRLHFHRVCVL